MEEIRDSGRLGQPPNISTKNVHQTLKNLLSSFPVSEAAVGRLFHVTKLLTIV